MCASCGQGIFDGQYLQALNADWHADCFRWDLWRGDINNGDMEVTEPTQGSATRVTSHMAVSLLPAPRGAQGPRGHVVGADVTVPVSPRFLFVALFVPAVGAGGGSWGRGGGPELGGDGGGQDSPHPYPCIRTMLAAVLRKSRALSAGAK